MKFKSKKSSYFGKKCWPKPIALILVEGPIFVDRSKGNIRVTRYPHITHTWPPQQIVHVHMYGVWYERCEAVYKILILSPFKHSKLYFMTTKCHRSFFVKGTFYRPKVGDIKNLIIILLDS